MAVNYTRKRGCWTEEEMKNAINLLIISQISIRKVSRRFKIPFKTLRDKFQAIRAGETVALAPRFGRFRTYSKELEAELVNILKEADKMLMPFTRDEFLKLVYDIAELHKRPHQFNTKTKTAGKQFYYYFVMTYPEAPFKTPDILGFDCFDKQKVKHFFDTYENLIREHKFTSDRIHNCDYVDIPIDNKIITVLVTINAAGNLFIPPLFIIPYKNEIDSKSMIEAPLGSVFIAEDDGRISGTTFKKYLELLVQKTRPTKENPILLMLDGQGIHKDADVILYAKENHIYMLSFIAGTASKMQPIERKIIDPFRTAFEEACKIKLSSEFFGNIKDKDIPRLVNVAYSAIYRKDLAQDAFKCTGLYPVNRTIYVDNDFLYGQQQSFTSTIENLDYYKNSIDTTKSVNLKNLQESDMMILETSESVFSEYPEVLEFALSASSSLTKTQSYDYDKSCSVH